jgi:hypothetical protein
MAVTQNTYTGNGSTVLYSFTFPYLNTSDIKVSLDGTVTTAYTLANATTVQFTSAPANGVAIRIYRETDDAALEATFFPGSAIRAQDLNSDFNQSLYIAQETRDRNVDPNNGSMLNNLNMNNYKITNLATPTASTDAANKAYTDNVILGQIPDGTLTNAKISATAAIAGTKISPNFGSQTVTTTGSVGIGTSSPGARLDILGTTPSLHVGDNTGGTPDYRGYSLDLSRRQQTGGINFTDASSLVCLDLYAGGSAANLGGWAGQIRFFTGSINSYGTERLRIDSSGSILANTTTNPTTGTFARPVISLKQQNDTTFASAIHIEASADQSILGIGYNGSAFGFGTSFRGTGALKDIFFAPGGTERMRITSGGLLNVGTATAPSGNHIFTWQGANRCNFNNTDATAASCYGLLINYTNAAPNGTLNEFLYCQDNAAGGTARAVIRANGGLANFQANNVNLSDINTKKDITPAADTWNCIKDWEIVNYRYKDQPDDADLNLGVIAQQVAESCPEVITVFQEAKEAKDAVLDEDGNETEPAQEAQPERLGIKEQQMAIKALQEAQARIETLEAKVAALEAA